MHFVQGNAGLERQAEEEHERRVPASPSELTPGPEAVRQRRRAALLSFLAATGMTTLKLVAGLLTGSLAMLSDAAHSGLDLAGVALTLFSINIANKPADDNHPYGHAKFENMSAFAETVLMAGSCLWIVYEAINRIRSGQIGMTTSLWPFFVVLLSIAVDLGRSRHLRKVASQYPSIALEADALHFESDIWTSLAVLFGLGGSWIGHHFGLTWLRYADPVAALLVSMLILRFSWTMARDTVGILLDQVPGETRLKMLHEVEKVPGVLEVESARVRRAGAGYFADLAVALPRTLTFQRTEEIVRQATAAVETVLPNADVTVRTVPREARTESIFDRARAVAASRNMMVHDLSVQMVEDRLTVEQHVEVPENMPLKEAHDLVSALEADMQEQIPEIHSVLTHIESEAITVEHPRVVLEANQRLERNLREAAAGFPQIVDIHDVVIGRTADHIQLSCHCTLPDDMAMERVHEVITSLEDRFKIQSPEVYKVLIHPEPMTDNTR